ncbi:hypothetical protein HY030_01380 [Candidatus Gottesmanbacteria bacterium]|nr:hypothetical protein [Candidatus Gottesmanbacteria bacterium]
MSEIPESDLPEFIVQAIESDENLAQVLREFNAVVNIKERDRLYTAARRLAALAVHINYRVAFRSLEATDKDKEIDAIVAKKYNLPKIEITVEDLEFEEEEITKVVEEAGLTRKTFDEIRVNALSNYPSIDPSNIIRGYGGIAGSIEDIMFIAEHGIDEFLKVRTLLASSYKDAELIKKQNAPIIQAATLVKGDNIGIRAVQSLAGVELRSLSRSVWHGRDVDMATQQARGIFLAIADYTGNFINIADKLPKRNSPIVNT